MSQQTYTLSRSEIEALLAKFARLIGAREQSDRAELWVAMYAAKVIAQVGIK